MLLGYVMAGVVDPGFVHKLDQEINSSNIKPDDVYIRQMLGNRFVKYMREKIYGAMTPKISPSCYPTADYVNANKPVALMYSTIDDMTSGNIWNSQTFEGHCRGQGGWYMSANELAAFVANFSAGAKLISKELREKMFDPGDPDERLVWSRNNDNDPWFQATFGQGTYPYHGGDHGEGNGEAHATVLQLPHNYYAVGVINSGPLGSANLTRRILDAFRAGVEKK